MRDCEDLRKAIRTMGFKPRTNSDGYTVLYLAVLAERPLLTEEMEIPPGAFTHAAKLWLERRNLPYAVRYKNGMCFLTHK